MKKVLLVFGTRPEAIKMCPLVKELEKSEVIKPVVCVTGQHKEMLKQVLDIFNVVPDYDLKVMKAGQTLSGLTIQIMTKLDSVLEEVSPNLVLVHGDTSTAFVTALSCFYKQIPVGHVEAGLRTYDIYSPFPEEFNREGVGLISRFNFSPTKAAEANLLKEGKDPGSVYVTGNTVLDAVRTTVGSDIEKSEYIKWAEDSRLILLTIHRRESFGDTMRHMFEAINEILREHPDCKVIYPVHLNPNVRKLAYEVFEGNDRVRLIEPLDVVEFHHLMNAAYLIATDSGGIQEEAFFLNKPVIVMRDKTERMEGVEAGGILLAGTKKEKIVNSVNELLDNKEKYNAMAKAENPFGDGYASVKIRKILEKELL